MIRWMVRREGEIESDHEDESEAWEVLREAMEDAQDEIATDCCFDEAGHEYAALYRLDPVPRSALRDGAAVPPGDLFLTVKVAWVELRDLGRPGDGTEAGVKAEARGHDFWAEAVIVKADEKHGEVSDAGQG
jgi:hypothetical protein